MLSETKEIEEFFKKDVLFFMRTLLGPIQGMNLRNLVWHGFLNEKIFPDCYASLILVLIVSLPELNPIFEKFKRRQLFNDMKWVESLNFKVKLKEKFLCNKEELKNVEEIVNNCKLISDDYKKDWIKSFTLFQKNQNYQSLVYLYPLMENLLRT